MVDFVVQMKTGCVALVLCLNISVDPPDVIKISPCARMECWIGKLLVDYSFQISN
jgi:regulator-associated protein of mTOR